MISMARLLGEYVEVTYQDRSFQPRASQVTVSYLAHTFQLVGSTIILISLSGTVAIPDDDGSFPDLDTLLAWTVKGDQVTTAVRSVDGPSSWALGKVPVSIFGDLRQAALAILRPEQVKEKMQR